MAAPEYDFTTRWLLPYPIDDVFAVLSAPEELSRWWPSVYLAVDEVEHGDENGHGKVVSFFTKGWLPYTLRWNARTTEVVRPTKIKLEASGDLDGWGEWTLTPLGADTEVVYRWVIRAEKALLKHLSFALRPAFEANHRWAMAQGEASIRLELQRRHESDPARRAEIPAAPGATPSSSLPLVLGAVGSLALASGAAVLLGRRRR